MRLLKPDAIPTINLPADLNQIKEVSQSTLHRRQKMESRAKKQVNNIIYYNKMGKYLSNYKLCSNKINVSYLFSFNSYFENHTSQ